MYLQTLKKKKKKMNVNFKWKIADEENKEASFQFASADTNPRLFVGVQHKYLHDTELLNKIFLLVQ